MVVTHGSSYRAIGMAPTSTVIPWMCHTYGATHLLVITEVPVQFVEVGGHWGQERMFGTLLYPNDPSVPP